MLAPVAVTGCDVNMNFLKFPRIPPVADNCKVYWTNSLHGVKYVVSNTTVGVGKREVGISLRTVTLLLQEEFQFSL